MIFNNMHSAKSFPQQGVECLHPDHCTLSWNSNFYFDPRVLDFDHHEMTPIDVLESSPEFARLAHDHRWRLIEIPVGFQPFIVDPDEPLLPLAHKLRFLHHVALDLSVEGSIQVAVPVGFGHFGPHNLHGEIFDVVHGGSVEGVMGST